MKKLIVCAVAMAFCLPMVGCAKKGQSSSTPVTSGHVTYHSYQGGKLGKLGTQK